MSADSQLVRDAEIFDACTSRYGGRLKREILPEPSIQKHYSTIEGWAQALISAAKEDVPRLPQIHFDFVHSGVPNAFAFMSRGRYFIALTTGVRYLLELVMGRILSDSRLLQMVGDSSTEADDLPLLSDYAPHAEEMYQAGIFPHKPRSPARRSYMTYVIHQAIQFLVGHEIAHISLGHVDSLASESDSPFIAEVGWINGDEQSIQRQTLEWQADLRSLSSAMASLKLTFELPSRPTPPWAMERETPGVMIFHWAFAVNTLFRLLGDGRFNPENLADASHPPFAIRRAMLMKQLYGWAMENWTQAPKAAVIAAIRLALQQTEAAFSQILGENPSLGGLSEAFSVESDDHQKRLVDFWIAGLSDRIAPFSYEG